MARVKLGEIARTRSGDKGAHSNVGVWTDSERRYQILKQQLTPEVVKAHFAEICRGPVVRYELPNLLALNFVLHDALGGGGSVTLRTDAQGKVYGLAMALLPIEIGEEDGV